MWQMLHFDVHGITLRVLSSDASFIAIVQRYLSAFAVRGFSGCADLEVRFVAYLPAWSRRSLGIHSRSSDTRRFGTGIDIGPELLTYVDSRFLLEASVVEQRLSVTGFFRERIDHGVRRLFSKELTLGNYMSILRTLVLYPLFQLQEDRFGRGLVHAAMIERDGQALAFVGFNGSGKSTFAAFLQARHGWNFMSDNYALFDEDLVYGFPEVQRLSADAIRLLGLPAPTQSAHGKFHVPPGRTSAEAHLHAISFVSIGSRFEIRAVTPQEMCFQIERMHDVTKEFPRYHWPALLGFMNTSSVKHQREELSGLCLKARCWSLTLPPMAELCGVASDALRVLLS